MFYICKWLVWIAMKIAFSVKLEGKENIPKDTNCIFASNHRTNADPPLISCGLKGKHSFMAKEELFKNKFFAKQLKKVFFIIIPKAKNVWEFAFIKA
jgi:1-acyl-sn-glycerol-3-phosphate acyltransferase/cytidylate kinase